MATETSMLGAGEDWSAAERGRLPLLRRMLSQIEIDGQLTVIESSGRRSAFGRPGAEPAVCIRLHDALLAAKIALNPVLAAGEAYLDGRLTLEQGNLRDLFKILGGGAAALLDNGPARHLALLQKLGMLFTRANGRARSRRNVEHHYDLPAEFYDLFLDDDRVYSCAYFERGDETLGEAQQAKLRRITDKLCIRPGDRVLDVGSGWGALATLIAADCDCHVKGVSLSQPQVEHSRARAARLGLDNRVEFALLDYRDETARYDRLVSVGMLEHVGRRQLDCYFRKVAELLDDDGVALIHSIGRADTQSARNDWINRYIFPGGYIPSISEATRAAERAGLWITDIEVLRLHYAETLQCWWDRFQANRPTAVGMVGERFCRMWEFYLALSEAAFRYRSLMVFQIQLARRRDSVPLTRDYLARAASRTPRSAAA